MTSPQQHVAAATREVEAAIRALDRFQPTHKAPEATQGADPGCLGHRKAGVFEPSGPVKGACRWCYDFQRKYNRTPPPELVAHHDAGYPLKDSMLKEALKRGKGKHHQPKAAPAKPPRPISRRTRMSARIAEIAKRMGVST